MEALFWGRLLLAVALSGSAAGSLCGATATAGAEGPAPRNVSAVRDLAYLRFGTGVIEALKGLEMPGAPLEDPAPFRLPIDWERQARENTERYPLRDWHRVLGNGVPAANINFNPAYVQGSRAWFDAYFKSLPGDASLAPAERAKLAANEALIRSRSMAYCMVWKASDAQLVYYPGDINFRGGSPERLGPWIPRAPAAITSQARSDYKLCQDPAGLAAIFNGVFYQKDDQVYVPGQGRVQGGFGFDYQAMLDPQPGMATMAIYGDGTLRLGAWQDLPEHPRIRIFVQNLRMVLQRGRPGPDARPRAFNRFNDLINRAYLCTLKDGSFAYLWTAYLPVEVLVPLAQSMGVQDMMLLDVHSVIACLVYERTLPDKAYWAFVPQIREVSRAYKALVSFSQMMKMSIQDHYPAIAFKDGDKNWFGVYKKGSPEARRVAAPDPVHRP